MGDSNNSGQQTIFLFLFSIAILRYNRMKPDRNGPCPCGSDKKFKHCCIGLHNERIRWDGLEDSLRNKIDDYWKEFYYDKYTDDAMDIYGNEDIESCADICERRLFFDWFIHDYIIPDKRDTVIRLFIREYEVSLVDDESDVCFVLRKVLCENGFVVDSYENPMLALEKFNALSYDLVILDIKMPDLNGFALYREIKRLDKKVKICFLTAGEVYYGEYPDIFSSLQANCFIRKPLIMKS